MEARELLQEKLEKVAEKRKIDKSKCSIDITLWEKGRFSRTYINFKIGSKTLSCYIDNKTGYVFEGKPARKSLSREIQQAILSTLFKERYKLMIKSDKKKSKPNIIHVRPSIEPYVTGRIIRFIRGEGK